MIRLVNMEAVMTIRPFEITDEDSVVALWERCELIRPWNDPRKDIQRKLAVRPDLFLVGILDQEIIATVMAGYDGHRGWINYLAVDPSRRRQNHGRAVMEEAERLLGESGAPKINLQVRASNSDVIAFYQRLGYTVEDVVNLGKRLVEDGPRVE